MKLHVGSGNVYLLDWKNVDLPGMDVFLARERPDLVDQFSTTEDAYYARHQDKQQASLRDGPVRSENICDDYGSFTFLPSRASSVMEILSRQTFEHLSTSDGIAALKECHRVLIPNGLLRLDVPDPDETLRLYRSSGDDFWIRHLFGPRRNEYGGHTPYSREMLTSMARSCGFNLVDEEPNIHFYPAFCLRFAKCA